MDEWISAIRAVKSREYYEPGHPAHIELPLGMFLKKKKRFLRSKSVMSGNFEMKTTIYRIAYALPG